MDNLWCPVDNPRLKKWGKFMNPHINKRSRALPPWGHLMYASRIAFEQQPPISHCVARVEPKVVSFGVHWVNCGALWALVDIWHMICRLPCGTPHHTAMLYRRHPNPAYCLAIVYIARVAGCGLTASLCCSSCGGAVVVLCLYKEC